MIDIIILFVLFINVPFTIMAIIYLATDIFQPAEELTLCDVAWDAMYQLEEGDIEYILTNTVDAEHAFHKAHICQQVIIAERRHNLALLAKQQRAGYVRRNKTMDLCIPMADLLKLQKGGQYV